jgi:hypothetical protein
MVSQNTQSITQVSSADGPATPTKGEESPSKFVNSPNPKGTAQTPEQPAATAPAQPAPTSLTPAAKPKPKFKERKLDANGNKRNFYNPPGKVMRHLAQQSYYDNFYGNQGQFYTLKQKFKTQMCKHFLEDGLCPLQQYCQFAHGPEELRQPNDPLPKHFGKTALGAVHSNYKTEPCKYWLESGECKFGDGCSFYHTEQERRRLIDPLPNLPEGVTLPPMPEKVKNFKPNNKGAHNDQNPVVGHFSPMQPQPMIQLTSLADIVALGGFNPNKYLSPPPMPFGAPQPFASQFTYQQSFVPPHILHQQQMNMNQTQGPTAFVPKAKFNKNSQKYEKKSPSNKSKKEKATGEKKYSPKQKATEAPAAEKAQE